MCALTWNTFRDHLILEYEIPKWDGDLGRPSVFMPISEAALERKIELLHHHFPSQATKPWFDRDTFRGLGAPAWPRKRKPDPVRRGVLRAQAGRGPWATADRAGSGRTN